MKKYLDKIMDFFGDIGSTKSIIGLIIVCAFIITIAKTCNDRKYNPKELVPIEVIEKIEDRKQEIIKEVENESKKNADTSTSVIDAINWRNNN